MPIGRADVRAVFTSGSGKVAGCMVTEGKLVKGCGCKVIRGRSTVHTGNLASLRRVKELAKEVCGGFSGDHFNTSISSIYHPLLCLIKAEVV